MNPRFPHRLSVLRPKRVGDSYVLDDNGDPVYETVTLKKVRFMDWEPMKDENGFITDDVTELEYGYRVSTKNTSDTVDVITSAYKIATPMIVTEIKHGDILMLTDYNRTYRGDVIKVTTFNWGTNIWFNEYRN